MANQFQTSISAKDFTEYLKKQIRKAAEEEAESVIRSAKLQLETRIKKVALDLGLSIAEKVECLSPEREIVLKVHYPKEN